MTAGLEIEIADHVPSGPARLAERVLSRLLRLPPARNDYRVERDVAVATRDGVVLLADHYVPLTAAQRGTVLIRTPYGRGFPGDLLDARVCAARGYHVLMQSCRGTYGSGGRFDPMVHEAEDSQDTVAWLRRQPWFDGRLATLGASYLGWVQWALLLDPPPELRTAIVLVGPHDMFRAVQGTGAFTLNDALSWSELMIHQEVTSLARGMLRTATAKRRLEPAFSGLPLADAAERLLDHRAPWFHAWLTHPESTDAYWDRLKAGAALERVRVPVRLVAGWQDIFLNQTVEQYEALRRRGVDVSLTVGPWTHLQVGTRGAGRVAPWQPRLARRAPVGGGPGIRAREGAGRDLRHRSSQRAGVARAAGVAAAEPVRRSGTSSPAAGSPPTRPTGAGPSTSFLYDPSDPTPTRAGRLLTSDAGVRDDRPLEARDDVVTFTSPPLADTIEVVGVPVVELALTVDNPYADVFVRLCDVDAEGVSRNVCDGFVRLDPAIPAGEVQRLDARARPVRAPVRGRAPDPARRRRRVAPPVRPERGHRGASRHEHAAAAVAAHRVAHAERGIAPRAAGPAGLRSATRHVAATRV